MIALIDADSLVYVIGWNYREYLGIEPEQVHNSCDNMLRDIVTLTGASHYIGAFSDKKCFRHECYKYQTYKGSRGDKPDWVTYWEPVIKEYYTEKHGFFMLPNLEADDVVSAYSQMLDLRGDSWVICSPDKDMLQIRGVHYDYRKTREDIDRDNLVRQVSEDQAWYNFWMQMLTGDESDSVAGVPGLGPVKAKKLLDEQMDPMLYTSSVKGAYKKYFGPHYGGIIYEETYRTLKLLCPDHPEWDQFGGLFQIIDDRIKVPKTAIDSLFDV